MDAPHEWLCGASCSKYARRLAGIAAMIKYGGLVKTHYAGLHKKCLQFLAHLSSFLLVRCHYGTDNNGKSGMCVIVSHFLLERIVLKFTNSYDDVRGVYKCILNVA